MNIALRIKRTMNSQRVLHPECTILTLTGLVWSFSSGEMDIHEDCYGPCFVSDFTVETDINRKSDVKFVPHLCLRNKKVSKSHFNIGLFRIGKRNLNLFLLSVCLRLLFLDK